MALLAGHPGLGDAALHDLILGQIAQFVGTMPQGDDTTLTRFVRAFLG